MSTLTTTLAAKGITATEIDTVRNSNVCKGYILENGTNIKPVIYYSADDTEESFVERAMITVSMPTPHIDAEEMISRENLLSKTYLCIQKQGEEPIIKKKFLDLELYVRLGVDIPDDESKGSIKVTPALINRAGLSEDELFAAAERNSIKKVTISSMTEVLEELGVPADLINETPFYVATYHDRTHGAGIMALPEVLHNFCEEKGYSRISIIPSSIEEVLLLPVESIDPEDLAAMVSDVNRSTVDPTLQLNPTAYTYDDATRKVSIASSIREEA